MFRCAILVAAVCASVAHPDPPTDRHGDPLPAGAISRLGTTRFRPGSNDFGLAPGAISPDSALLATGERGMARLWDLKTGKELHAIPIRYGEGHVYDVAFVPRSRRLVALVDIRRPTSSFENVTQVLVLIDPTESKVLAEYPPLRADQTRPEIGLAHPVFTDGGRRLFITEFTDDQSDRLQALESDTLKPTTGYPGGFLVAVGSGRAATYSTNLMRMFDENTGREVERWEAMTGFLSVAAHLKSSRFVAYVHSTPPGPDRAMAPIHGYVVLRGPDGTERRLLTSVPYEVEIAFSPDGRFIATAELLGPLTVWDAATAKRVWSYDRQTRCGSFGHAQLAFAFAPDSGTIVLGESPDWIRCCEVATGNLVRRWRSDSPLYGSLLFSPDGATLCHIWRTIHVWDAATGEDRADRDSHGLPVTSINVSADGQRVTTFDSGDSFRVWNIRTGQPLPAQAPAWWRAFRFGDERSVDASANGTTITATEGDITVRDATGRPRFAIKGSFPVRGISVDASSVATFQPRDCIRLWDVATGRVLRTIRCPDPSSMTNAAFHALPDGRIFARISDQLRNGCCSLVDTSTGRVVVTLTGEADPIAFSPDGRIVASGRDAITLRETLTGAVIGTIPAAHRGGPTALRFTPDGSLLLSGRADTSVLVWDWPAACGLRTGGLTLETAWSDLAGADAGKAYAAIFALRVRADAAGYLRARLKPTADAERVRALISQLDDDRFAVRERASAELRRHGLTAMPGLRRALTAAPSPEAGRRIALILDSDAAQHIEPEVLQTLRAVAALEEMDTPDARSALRDLAAGNPDDVHTAAAKRALR